MIVVKLLGLLLSSILVYFIGACIYLHRRTQTSGLQSDFLAGTIPLTLPDGLYQGTVNLKTSWLGKRFDRDNQTGINILQDRDAFPFKTSVGPGNVDPKLQVVKIDYNVPANPFYLRPIMDEIVETKSGHFLGKLQLRLLPGVSIALGYFTLDQRDAPTMLK